MSRTKAWGGYEVTFDGDEQTHDELLAMADAAPEAVGAAFHEELNAELDILEALTPIGGERDPHVGRLRGSERLLDPIVFPDHVGDGASMVVVNTLLIGGPSVGVEYAIAQEVRDWYAHPHGGQAHYLEAIVDQLKSGPVLEHVAERLRGVFGV